MTWQKAKNITLSRSGENGRCLPSLVTSENIILSSCLIPTGLMLLHLLKHTIQKCHCGNEGWRFREGLRCFAHGLSERRDIFLIFFLARPIMTLWPRAPRINRGLTFTLQTDSKGVHSLLLIPHTSNIGLYLPAFLPSWHWPQLQRLPLGPLNGLCKQAGWLLGQVVYFVYSGTIPSRHVSKTKMAFGPHTVAAPSYQLAPLLPSSDCLTHWLLKCYPIPIWDAKLKSLKGNNIRNTNTFMTATFKILGIWFLSFLQPLIPLRCWNYSSEGKGASLSQML